MTERPQPESAKNFSEPTTKWRTESRALPAEMLLLGVVVVWALNFPLAKWAVGEMNFFVFNGLRFCVAAATVALVLPFTARWRPIEPGDWRRLVQLGLLGNVLYQSCFILGVTLTTAGNSAVLISTAPLWTAVWQTRLHMERLAPTMWTGLLISLMGVAMIVAGSGKKIEFGSASVWGDSITLCAAILWALNTNVQKTIVARYPSAQVALVTVCVGAVVLSAMAIPAAINTDWQQLTWKHYAAAAASGSLSIGLSYVIWAYGVKKLGPSRTANFGNLVPILAFAFSHFVLREPHTTMQIIGACVTIGGVWLARR